MAPGRSATSGFGKRSASSCLISSLLLRAAAVSSPFAFSGVSHGASRITAVGLSRPSASAGNTSGNLSAVRPTRMSFRATHNGLFLGIDRHG
jgi:hypothetical protein